MLQRVREYFEIVHRDLCAKYRDKMEYNNKKCVVIHTHFDSMELVLEGHSQLHGELLLYTK